MRTLCDVCEGAAAVLFCAADEAALCRACDDKACLNHLCVCVFWTFNVVKVESFLGRVAEF